MSKINELRALIIDPQTNMRMNLHNMLNQCKINKIDHAISAGTALNTLKAKPFDVILCEYDLGIGQDGQQLLEDLRHHKIIPLSTIFFMVTAESSYEKVVSAAELAPTDYLLKPFSADSLLDRLHRSITKQSLMAPTYTYMENGQFHEAVGSCIAGEQKHPKFSIDFQRLRAELLTSIGEIEAAQALYQKIFQVKPVGWAKLGVAKSMLIQNKHEESQILLKEIMNENEVFLGAYDLLAQSHEATGDLDAAKHILNKATDLSPHAVRRLRKLSEVAVETGDMDLAETTLKKVVSKVRYSEFRDPEDYVKLVNVLVQKGDAEQAKSIIRGMEKSMGELDKTEACRIFSNVMVYEKTKDKRLKDELDQAIQINQYTDDISNVMKLNLAKVCLNQGMDVAASQMIAEVVKNSKNEAETEKALKVFDDAGKGNLGLQIYEQAQNEIKTLVADGVKKAKEGDLRGAKFLLFSAARKSPNNTQVLLNAALAGLKYIESEGWDEETTKETKKYLNKTAALDPMNERLKAMRKMLEELQKKFGIDASMESLKAAS